MRRQIYETALPENRGVNHFFFVTDKCFCLRAGASYCDRKTLAGLQYFRRQAQDVAESFLSWKHCDK